MTPEFLTFFLKKGLTNLFENGYFLDFETEVFLINS